MMITMDGDRREGAAKNQTLTPLFSSSPQPTTNILITIMMVVVTIRDIDTTFYQLKFLWGSPCCLSSVNSYTLICNHCQCVRDLQHHLLQRRNVKWWHGSSKNGALLRWKVNNKTTSTSGLLLASSVLISPIYCQICNSDNSSESN